MEGQQGKAAPASHRLRAPIGRFPSAPSDVPTPPLSFATGERGGAELAGRIDFLDSGFSSHLLKSPALDSRPPEFAADPDLDPSAALLLRVSAGPASDLQPDPSPGRIAGGEGEGPTPSPIAGREGEGPTPSPIAGREGEGSTPSTQGGPIAVKGQEAQSGGAVVPKATNAVVPKAPKTLTATTAIHTSKDLAGSSRPPALTSDLRPTASRDAIAWREGESDSHEGEGSTPSTQDRGGPIAVKGQQAQAGCAVVPKAAKTLTATTAIHSSKDLAGHSRPPLLTSVLRPAASRDAIAWREGEGDSHHGEGSAPSTQDRGGPIAVKGQEAQSGCAVVPKATKISTASTAANTPKNPALDSRPPGSEFRSSTRGPLAAQPHRAGGEGGRLDPFHPGPGKTAAVPGKGNADLDKGAQDERAGRGNGDRGAASGRVGAVQEQQRQSALSSTFPRPNSQSPSLPWPGHRNQALASALAASAFSPFTFAESFTPSTGRYVGGSFAVTAP
jgi:hypothetical protein